MYPCAKCKNKTAFTKPDYSKPAEKCYFYNGSAEEAQWNMLFPMKERTGNELCYICEKEDLRLIKLSEAQEATNSGILTY